MSQKEVKEWLKNKYHLSFVALLALTLIVRIYFFIQSSGQTLWWDEAEYMATAKHWAFGVPYDLNLQRPPLFQLLAVPLLKIGLEEGALKFLLVLLPSVFVIAAIYFLGKELFNKKVALIAAFASSFVWSFLFWSVRFQPDFFSLSLQLLSLLFFWKLFKEDKKKYALYGGMFAALAFYFKISALLIPLALLLFVLFKDGFSFIKKKNYWIALASFVLTLVPFAIWQYSVFGNPLAFAPSYIGGTGIGQGWDFGWMVFQFFYQFPKPLFFILFVIGAGAALLNMVLSTDIYLKNKERRLDAHVFSLLLLVVIILFYVFYIRGTIEDRWVFIIIPFIMYFAAEGLISISEMIGKNNKKLILGIVLLCLSIFMFYQLQHTNSLIDLKKESYLPVKEASLWIKENSEKEDTVMSVSYTQATAYTERKVITYPPRVRDPNSSYAYIPSQIEMMDRLIEENHPKYLMVSVFEVHPDWTQQWLNENSARLLPVKVYFADPQQKQVLLVVYEIKYD